MAVAIITGSGAHALPGFAPAESRSVPTPYGDAEVARGSLGTVEVWQISRHGPGHARLSSAVNHRANIWALRELGADAVIGTTACGAVDATLELGQLVVFDDLWFLTNRLPGGTLCTFFDQPGDPERAHWVLHGGPFSDGVRVALLAAAREVGVGVRDGGAYGHVDGPRFNTPVEIAQLATAGVVAVSQTGGPETVLCGELALPYGLVGFVTDHANEVRPGATTPVAVLAELLGSAAGVFARVLEPAVARLAVEAPAPAGTILRIGT